MKSITDKLQNLWSSDEIRVLVLTSLGIQMGLIFLAPLRKRSTKMVLTLTLWLLYLTADNVATYGLGNISNQTPAGSGVSSELTVLWAPFLLVHLGGPDTITSYAIEDNELWWRHLLGLVSQVIVTVYVFLQSPTNGLLWIPTIFVFIPGLIKFAERTHALRLASKDNIKDKIISELRPGSMKDIPMPDSQAIWEGFHWFNIFKRLLVDVTFPAEELMKSQDRIAGLTSTEALKLVAIELSFLYDILHTKAVHMHTNLGRVLRGFSLVSIIAALVVFHHLDMQKYVSKDIIITYILFGAGLSLEVIATMLLVFSDWMVVTLTENKHSNCFASCITAMVKRITFRKGIPRWAHTIGHYNLVGVSLRDRDTVLANIMRKLRIKHIWDNFCESTILIPITELLEKIMFTEAKRRAQNVHIYNVLLMARAYRGNKALERHGQLTNLEWSMKREFDECIILWHLATDICYYNDSSNQPKGSDDTERDVSWKTSNYMVYLLTQQQSMMQLGYGKTRFEATCAVVKKKFKGKGKLKDKDAREVLKAAPVLEQNDAQEPADGRQPTDKKDTFVLKKIWAFLRCWGRRKVEDDKRKGEDEMGELVLKDGLRLAKQLQEIKPDIKKWQVISETWMEMLGYAAIHCDSYQHAKTLSRGGELLTHLWLLMAQLGVVEEHKVQQYQSGSV
ncbi:hypothetical protein FCM35_KLT17024 [Carex littledalei]|uniref:DUF4220 domain-containing protein n=1 Tax=Carex littledalei TaxID=544730 RepID=A0A833VFV0_9POAL|nr:hypothetical protein FCM35_KLT17024 [Carex littledalei]